MSDNNENVRLTAPENPEYKTTPDGSRYVEIVPSKLNVTEQRITREKSRFKGFVYHSPEYTDLELALKIVGSDLMLYALNAFVQRAIYTRVQNTLNADLPEDPAKQNEVITRLLQQNPDRFSIQDALDFKYGEREVTPTSVSRQITKKMMEASKLMSEGKMSEASAIYTQVSELMQIFNEALAAKMRDVEAE